MAIIIKCSLKSFLCVLLLYIFSTLSLIPVFDFNIVLNSIIETGEPPKSYLYSGNQKDGRGNICPVTIILPTLAMQCRKSFDNDVKNGYSSNDESILIDRCFYETIG